MVTPCTPQPDCGPALVDGGNRYFRLPSRCQPLTRPRGRPTKPFGGGRPRLRDVETRRPPRQAPRRLLRLGVRRLARRILPGRDAEIRLPDIVLQDVRRRRDRLIVLPDPATRDDRELAAHR